MASIELCMRNAYKAPALYRPLTEDIRCRNCGTKLKAYYAEDRLYAVKCGYCETITLVEASNPQQAARFVGDTYGVTEDTK